jgi:hypothetical protein
MMLDWAGNALDYEWLPEFNADLLLHVCAGWP